VPIAYQNQNQYWRELETCVGLSAITAIEPSGMLGQPEHQPHDLNVVQLERRIDWVRHDRSNPSPACAVTIASITPTNSGSATSARLLVSDPVTCAVAPAGTIGALTWPSSVTSPRSCGPLARWRSLSSKYDGYPRVCAVDVPHPSN
jgi:hypothetical protein